MYQAHVPVKQKKRKDSAWMINGVECTWFGCSKCGRVQHHCISTNSVIVCNHCHNKYYAFAEKGIVLLVPAEKGMDKLYAKACEALTGQKIAG